MPELPEVETVRRTLEPLLKGLKIIDIELFHQPMFIDSEMMMRLKGQTIHNVERIGKHLLFMLDHDVLISHLRMEGKYFYSEPRDKLKHEHVIFYLDNGYTLRYHDVRKFGTFHLKSRDTYKEVPPLSKVGREPHDMSAKTLHETLQKKKITIKQALLDQSVMSGLGNIYVDETLFRCHIHPETSSENITLSQCQKIILAADEVLTFATSLGGSTIRSYYATIGISGKFQNELKVHTRVNQKCMVCDDMIIKIKVGGRGTYVCPSCQKKD